MNPENVNENILESANFSSSVKKKNKFLIPGLFFILLLILGLGFYLFTQTNVVDFKKPLDIIEEEASKPEGEIYLTLSPLGTEKPNIYKLDVETMELEEYFKDSPYENYMAKFSSDRGEMVFVRSYEDGTSNIILYSESTGEDKELTKRSEFFPRNPVFSPDNKKIVFWVYEGEGSFASLPEGNIIYLIDINTSEINKVTMGAFPVFSLDDDSIFFLKSEGLYSLNLATKDELLVIDNTEGVLNEDSEKLAPELPRWLRLRINFSPEENLLALTNAASRISVFKIGSDFSYQIFLEKEAFVSIWPVFSRAGGFLAIQSSFVEEDNDYFYPSLEILDLDELNSLERYSLQDFDVNYIWLTDWIVR